MAMTLYTMVPPYAAAIPLRSDALEHDAVLRPGAVVVSRLHHDARIKDVVARIEPLALRLRTATLVVWADLCPREHLPRLGAVLASLGVQAIAPKPVVEVDRLRKQLCNPETLPDAVTQWLRLHDFAPSGTAVRLLAPVVAYGHAHGNFAELAAQVFGRSEVTVRRRFAAAGLGSPTRWHQLFRVFHAAVSLQREPAMAVSELAKRHGFYDASALRRRLVHVFGVNARDLRTMYLGWQWFLFPGVRRMGLTPGARLRG